ncbi:uncharacterized protein LOC142497064 isoform X3 [Ascaphus truei]|uniref:uncharacterized protein LOC142497064 isoform X3 n=1 Tax=Ascaphus truei TaxID=8439 RepID=UPI003F5A85C1
MRMAETLKKECPAIRKMSSPSKFRCIRKLSISDAIFRNPQPFFMILSISRLAVRYLCWLHVDSRTHITAGIHSTVLHIYIFGYTGSSSVTAGEQQIHSGTFVNVQILGI